MKGRTPPWNTSWRCPGTPTWPPTWPPGWRPSSQHRTASVHFWPARRRPRRQRSWPRRRRPPRPSLDASLSSLQVTATIVSIPRPTRRMQPPTAARVELLWSIVIGVFLAIVAITVLTRHALRVEHEQSRQEADAVRAHRTYRVRGEPADRAGDVEGRGFGLRPGLGGAQPSCPGHALRTAAGRFEHGPLPPGAGQQRAGGRCRLRRHVPRRLPCRIEGTDHGVPPEHGARRLSPPPRSGVLCACASR